MGTLNILEPESEKAGKARYKTTRISGCQQTEVNLK